jgi:hypothetical protein
VTIIKGVDPKSNGLSTIDMLLSNGPMGSVAFKVHHKEPFLAGAGWCIAEETKESDKEKCA